MSDPSLQAIRRQRINLIIAVIIVGVAAFGLGGYMVKNYRSHSYDLFEPKIDLPVDEFKSKEVWMDRLESQVNFLSQKQKYYEETLLEYKEKDQANEKEKMELKRHLAQLKKEMEESDERLSQVESDKQSPMEVRVLPEEHLHYTNSNEEKLTSLDISQKNLSSDPFTTLPYSLSKDGENFQDQLEETLKPPLCEYILPEEEKNNLFSVDKRTPANVSVKAILISSVDAVCRLNAQSDPIPVKLRLLDDGHLPSGVTVKLKGCLLGASAFGDISSERVYMRLENLTKVNPNGLAIESEVTGYISGEDGRFGMRGIVVDRSAKILKNAVGSGVLSGIAQTLQAACTRPPKENINAYTIGTDFAQSSANSTSDAFSMLASYYIKRAEQVQPVLQVNAGRIVDVTFTHGFSMGDIHARANLKKIRETSRRRS